MKEAVRELTAWVSSGPNWTYTLVQLNEDTHHAPLPKEGHLGVLSTGGTNSTACGSISQLEVCQLLILGHQVIYPVGLNGCKVPTIISLLESLANGIILTGGRTAYLEVGIPLPIAEKLDQKASPPGRCPSILIANPFRTTPPKPERKVSMTTEVTELLS